MRLWDLALSSLGVQTAGEPPGLSRQGLPARSPDGVRQTLAFTPRNGQTLPR
jgi:hypothetical protein